MATLTRAIPTLCLAAATPAHADSVVTWRPYVIPAAARFGVPIDWVEHVIAAESAGHQRLHGQPIVSRKGAMGLMQLMPRTWSDMRAALGLGTDPFDPRDNILAGTFYLRLMYDRFGYPGLFAAYNAGPGRYSAYLAGRKALPSETRSYVATVNTMDGWAHRPPTSQPDVTRSIASAVLTTHPHPLFIVRGTPEEVAMPMPPPDRNELFAIRKTDRDNPR